MTHLMVSSTVLLLSMVWTNGQVLQVRHDHNPRGKCQGELVIKEDGIEYRTQKEKHNRQWTWTEIQSFDRQSSTEFSVMTYEDQRWTFGTDRKFTFSIPSEQTALTEETFQYISAHLKRPVVDRMGVEIEAEYQVEVKHLHAFGGCEGTLYFGKDQIVYQSDKEKDSRIWNRDREVKSIWSLHRYQLEIHVFEEYQGGLDKTRPFRFQLKEPLDRRYYEQLRREFLVER